MSNALAIASVTYVLKDLLNNGLSDQDILSIIKGNVKVTSLPPDKIELGTITESQLNIFMYRVNHNITMRNIELPSRDSLGERTNNPPLVLDLHYLLTAYGVNELHAEVLLGFGIQLFHKMPVMGQAAIRSSLSPATVSGGDSTDELKALQNSKLAEQQIRIIPENLNSGEIFQLWAAFQSKFRPSASFQVSIVLI